MSNNYSHDAIIIGVGQAGNPLASALSGAGWNVAVIEREHVGGTCVNEGCTPTKTMVASARVAYLARRSAEYGVESGPVCVDMAVVRNRKQEIVDTFRNGIQRRLENDERIDLLMGEGSFIDAHTVEVTLNSGATHTVSAPRIFINTGTRSAIPSLPGLDEVPFLTSTTIMELVETPAHLLILGGGYIGLEFGQMFRRFGAEVTVVQRGPQLLSREDEDVAAEVAGILRDDGIQVLLNTDAVRVEQGAGDEVRLLVRNAEGERLLTGSHLLVATGRRPNVEALNLPAAGVATGKGGFIQVNEQLETSVPGIYALGDVKGGPAFTHISYDDFRILRTNLLEGGNATTEGRLVPYTVFIDPQLGRIGLTEAAARQQGRRARIARMPMSYVARAQEVDETRGLIKAIVDAESNQILGAAVLGIEGGEIASMFQIAMMGGLPYTALRDGVFPHPGLAEALNNLFAYNLQA
ncbi:MAG: FAD-containing oxidoreductase [Chloroflexi bacterium]|nr:MAG: FAD-containing oxidoreductase [Chloroflexota bacterium]